MSRFDPKNFPNVPPRIVKVLEDLHRALDSQTFAIVGISNDGGKTQSFGICQVEKGANETALRPLAELVDPADLEPVAQPIQPTKLTVSGGKQNPKGVH